MKQAPPVTLAEFLRARLAEDAETAGRLHDRGCGVNDDMGPTDCDCGVPARVLAEVEAKRRIVETIRDNDWITPAGSSMVTDGCAPLVLLELATVYAGHPDWREEWRP